ncbi:MAG: DUF2917 domain-containing protein [Luteolibacter sp.]
MNALIPLADFWRWIANRSCTQAGAFPLRLARRTAIRRTLAEGASLQCVRGSVWITSDEDRGDIVLRAGEIFSVPRRASFVIEALEDAVLQ